LSPVVQLVSSLFFEECPDLHVSFYIFSPNGQRLITGRLNLLLAVTHHDIEDYFVRQYTSEILKVTIAFYDAAHLYFLKGKLC